jgi:subtilisin family serine protease
MSKTKARSSGKGSKSGGTSGKSGGRRRGTIRVLDHGEVVPFEAVLKDPQKRSIMTPGTQLAAQNLPQFRPEPGRGVEAAKLLEAMGFKVRHIGTFSVSAEGPRAQVEEHFKTKMERRKQPISTRHPDMGEMTFLAPATARPLEMPAVLSNLVERALVQRPPMFFGDESPLPPRVGYHHLRVPSDVAAVLRALPVHKHGVTGQGVLVAMPDTGFYKHSFYDWHGYNYNATLAPDAVEVSHDEVGHGTAEAANIFANAPDIDFVGVKMGFNATLAFKTASDLFPAVMTNSWGYHLVDDNGAPLTALPDDLKPLEAAVIEAVRERGITVCFSAGNGHVGFPSMMPEVIAVGGVFARETLTDEGDFELEASNYASSFDSAIYPGRHVPDVCGLVGLTPRGVYIMLPVEPGDEIDTDLAGGGSFPDSDETAADDGWAVISGTSAASPQIAGVCALLKEVQPGLPPDLVKAVLRASARDVRVGQSAMGEPAGAGHDGATGAGLVDALAAYKLARSVTPQNLYSLPAPR